MEERGMKRYQLDLVCDSCKEVINQSNAIEGEEEARKAYNDAMFNPFLGWHCARKPYPVMYEIDDKTGARKYIKSIHPENHEETK
jgi:hypothetical protein